MSMNDLGALFIVPRLRIQNANAISSSMTWGFPAMSAFIGVMQALERKAADANVNVIFDGVGVICHHYEAQVSRNGFINTFNLTRNPLDSAGKTAAIVEEGRIHLEISFIFAIQGGVLGEGDQERKSVAEKLGDFLHSMRIAGGTVVSPLHGTRPSIPYIQMLPDNSEEQCRKFLSIRRRLMPGFSLILRDDLLQSRYRELLGKKTDASRLDAWLDLSRLNMECETMENGEANWEARRPPGWIVPIPIGYSALSPLYEPGSVANSRDKTTPFRFVESLYSIGQWVSPHRLKHPRDMLWYVDNDLEKGQYRLGNQNSLQRHSQEQEIYHG